MISLMASNYPHLILPSTQNHGESLAGFHILDETWTPALLIRWGKKVRPKICTSNRDEATTHGPDASANVPCGNWFWLPVWGFTITLLSRVYFAWTSTTLSMSTVIWGNQEFTSSPKSSGNWNKTPGSMTRDLRHIWNWFRKRKRVDVSVKCESETKLRSVVRRHSFSNAVHTVFYSVVLLCFWFDSTGHVVVCCSCLGCTGHVSVLCYFYSVVLCSALWSKRYRNKHAVGSLQCACLLNLANHVVFLVTWQETSRKQHTFITMRLSSFHLTFVIWSYCCLFFGDKLLLDIVFESTGGQATEINFE